MQRLSAASFQSLVFFSPFARWRIVRFLSLLLFLALIAVSVVGQTATDKMTNKKLQQILTTESKSVTGKPGNWTVNYKGIPVMVITDLNADRMRIIAPIIDEKKLTGADLKTLLEANFDTALDAKYALFRGILWSTFVHPLDNLKEDEIKDALKQVYNLLRTYGTTYSSTNFVFGKQEEQVQ